MLNPVIIPEIRFLAINGFFFVAIRYTKVSYSICVHRKAVLYDNMVNLF